MTGRGPECVAGGRGGRGAEITWESWPLESVASLRSRAGGSRHAGVAWSGEAVVDVAIYGGAGGASEAVCRTIQGAAGSGGRRGRRRRK